MNPTTPEPTTNTAEPSTLNLEPPTNSPEPAPCNESSEPSTCNLQLATLLAYRGNGKVARFPKPVRDQINHWLLDGVSYPDIIQRLGDQGKDLKPDNLSQWKKRGHQDWLLEQAWLEETRTRQEPASDLSADFDATQLNHAALQLGTLQIFEVLRDLTRPCTRSSIAQRDDTGADMEAAQHISQAAPAQSPSRPVEERNVESKPCIPSKEDDPCPMATAPDLIPDKTQRPPARSILDRRLGGDSAAFVRLINALVRASRETMLVQKYRDTCARARAALRELDPKRELDESETRAIVRKVDEILGLAPNSGRDELREPPSPSAGRLADLATPDANPASPETL